MVRNSSAGAAAVIGPELADHVKQNQAADDKHAQKHQRQLLAAVKEITDREQRGPNHRTARRPAEQREGHILMRGGGFLFGNARFLANALPAGAKRAHLLVELD